MSTPNFKLQFTNWQQEGIQSSRHQQGNICLSKCLLCHSLCLSQGFCEQLQEAECCIFRGRNNSPISAVLMHPFMSHFSTTLVVLLHAIQQHLCLCYWNKCVEACCTVNSRFKIKLGNRGCWEREWEVLMVGGKKQNKKTLRYKKSLRASEEALQSFSVALAWISGIIHRHLSRVCGWWLGGENEYLGKNTQM